MKLNEWVAAAASPSNLAGPQPAARLRVAEALNGIRGAEQDPIIFAHEVWPEAGAETRILVETVWAALVDGFALVAVNAQLNPSGHFLQGVRAVVDVRPWRSVELRLAGFDTGDGDSGEYTLAFGSGNPAKAEGRQIGDLLALWHESLRLACRS